MVNLKKMCIFLSPIMLLFLSGNVHAQEEDGFLSLYAGSLLSLSAEIDELDPFYGVGFAWQKGHGRIAFDYFSGEAKYEASGIEITNDDTLYGVTFDYIFTPVTNENPTYFGLGAGWFYEKLEFEMTSGSTTVTMDLSGSSLSAEAILGHKKGNIDLFARLLVFPQSDNVSFAVMLGLGIAF